MKEKLREDALLRKGLLCVLLLLLAVVSLLYVGDWAMKIDTHSQTIASIDEKVDMVMKLSAASAVASAGISAIPGDTATPIAEKLADFTEYFLLILCVLYSEKYLLTIMGAGTFRILIPLACALCLAGLFWNPKLLRRLAVKLAVIGLALYLVIPVSIRVSDAIYAAYEQNISAAITSAEELSRETEGLAEAGEDKGLLAAALERLSTTTEGLTNKASNILNRFVETLAVMIVTSCVIPILVLLFFLWVIKQLTGIDVSHAFARYREERGTGPRL